MYPLEYAKNEDCKWLIYSTMTYVELFFKDFFTEEDDDCQYDFIEVIGADGRKMKSCGDSINQEVHRFKSPVEISFTSDDSYQEKGFNITYSAGKISFFFIKKRENKFKLFECHFHIYFWFVCSEIC